MKCVAPIAVVGLMMIYTGIVIVRADMGVSGRLSEEILGRANMYIGNEICVSLSVETGGEEGTIKAMLRKDWAPKTVENFLAYVNNKYYDGTVFHRIIGNFMVQGGGFTENLYRGIPAQKKGQLPPIINEAGHDNRKGTLSMARTNDPNSATSQFFINLVDNAFLNKNGGNAGYAVFGEVTSGMDLVEKIGLVQTSTISGFENVPTEPVVLNHVGIVDC